MLTHIETKILIFYDKIINVEYKHKIPKKQIYFCKTANRFLVFSNNQQQKSLISIPGFLEANPL